jgi:hypothetical protein
MFDPKDLEWITAISNYLSRSTDAPLARGSQKGSIVSYGGTHRIKTEISEIFESQDVEWITAVSMMIDVMYQQFIRERCKSANGTVVLPEVIALSTATDSAVNPKSSRSA